MEFRRLLAIGASCCCAVVASSCQDDTPKSESSSAGGKASSASSGGSNAAGSTTTGGFSETGGTLSTGASVSSAGADASAGTAGVAGSVGGSPPGCPITWTGSATRPQLSDETAACFTIQKYLAQGGLHVNPTIDNWDPTAGLSEAGTLTPSFTVAADGSGTHASVQTAIDAANALGGTERVYILVKPGSYRELVCVKGTVPITLYGADPDATLVTIAYDNYNSKVVDTAHVNACAVPSGASYGTSGSTTVFVSSNGFQAMNLTVANDFAEGALTSSIQAVAMTAQGDQLIFQNVRLLGNQDTLQVKSATNLVAARSYFKNCYIEGDTDFIFGRGTAVFDGSTITYVSSRKTNSTHFAPSTESANPFGFLVVNSTITGDAAMPAETAYLGRAWDDSSAPNANGQLLIRDSSISNHIRVAAPWTFAATSGRLYNADTNRLYEYKNSGTGAAAQ